METTIGAELESPAKFCWISVRAATDSEPFACQPAPESAVSTCGANTASTTARDSPGEQRRPQMVGGPAAEPTDRPDNLCCGASVATSGASRICHLDVLLFLRCCHRNYCTTELL